MGKIQLGNGASSAKSAEVSAIIYRADGTVKQDLGVIAYYHKNPFKRFLFNVKQFFKRR